MTHRTDSRASMPGATSPVKAPLSSQWQVWAPTAIGRWSDSISVWTLRSATKDGHTTTSWPS